MAPKRRGRRIVVAQSGRRYIVCGVRVRRAARERRQSQALRRTLYLIPGATMLLGVLFVVYAGSVPPVLAQAYVPPPGTSHYTFEDFVTASR